MTEGDVHGSLGLECPLEDSPVRRSRVPEIQEDHGPGVTGGRPEARALRQPLRGPDHHPRLVVRPKLLEDCPVEFKDGLLRELDRVSGVSAAIAVAPGLAFGERPELEPAGKPPLVSRQADHPLDRGATPLLPRLVDRLVKDRSGRGPREPDRPVLGLAANHPPEIVPAIGPRGRTTILLAQRQLPGDLIAGQRRGSDPEPSRL